MARNFDLATLRSFLAVVESGGMTRAANRLHLSQSTVSTHIKRIERNLGLPILARNGHDIRPTAEGEHLLAYARRMVEANDEIWHRLTAPDYEGVVRLGVPSDITHPHIPKVLNRFGRSFPRVRTQLTTARTVELRADLERGAQDIVLTTEHEPGPEGTVVATKPLVWTGAPDGQAWRLRPLPLAFVRWCVFRDPTIEALEAAGIDWIDGVDADNPEPASLTAAADLAVRSDLEGFHVSGIGAIDHRGTLPALPKCSIVIYTGNGPNRAIIAALADLLRESYGS